MHFILTQSIERYLPFHIIPFNRDFSFPLQFSSFPPFGVTLIARVTYYLYNIGGLFLNVYF